jgi:hypothetical protein
MVPATKLEEGSIAIVASLGPSAAELEQFTARLQSNDHLLALKVLLFNAFIVSCTNRYLRIFIFFE